MIAREDARIDGVVMLAPAWAPNQPHRAEVCKLLVHRRARKHGLGRRLMEAIEAQARASGFALLTLDTCRGYDAERLYRRLGWSEAGVIPKFALLADGGYCDTVLFFKPLAS